MTTQKRIHTPGRWARNTGMALVGFLALAVSGPAHAFTYTSGDLVGIFVDGTTELIVNLGQADSLTDGASWTFQTPAGFGLDGATGGKFLAYSTEAPFSGSLGRNLNFTVESGVDPTSYNSNITGYVNRIGLAQLALDDGDSSPDRFFQLLNNFPLAGSGGVITNTANVLAILSSNPAGYTSTIGLNGSSDRVGNNLPFETDNLVGLNTQIALWNAVKVTNTLAASTLLAQLNIEGNIGGANPTARITYSTVPEPATLLLMGAALAGLSLIRRRAQG